MKASDVTKRYTVEVHIVDYSKHYEEACTDYTVLYQTDSLADAEQIASQLRLS